MVNYAPIWNSTKTEIVGYQKLDNYVGRRVPPKPTLDGLDGDMDHDANYRDVTDED